MCFSPEVSFIVGGGLGAVGAASALIAPKQKKLFAIFPLTFALQQLLEGVQWLSLRAGASCQGAAYGFLFIALLFWPTAIPIGVYIADKERRVILRWFVFGGLLLSTFFAYLMLTHGVAVSTMNKSIIYTVYNPLNYPMTALFYLFITSGALLASSIRAFRWFGVVAIFSAEIAYYFFISTFVSVWCFFAAILSAFIFFYVRHGRILPK